MNRGQARQRRRQHPQAQKTTAERVRSTLATLTRVTPGGCASTAKLAPRSPKKLNKFLLDHQRGTLVSPKRLTVTALLEQVKTLAKEEAVSINQLMTALMTEDYLEAWANQAAFERVLAKVPDTEPEVYDQL